MDKNNMKKLLFVPILLILGCINSDKIAIREGLYNGSGTLRQFAVETGAKLVINPTTGENHSDELPRLTPTQYQNLIKANEAIEELVQKDRIRDASK